MHELENYNPTKAWRHLAANTVAFAACFSAWRRRERLLQFRDAIVLEYGGESRRC